MASDHSSRISDQDGPLVGVARSAESTARNLTKEGERKLKDVAERSSAYVQDNPMKAILISAGVGALLGYMLGRRR